MKGEHLLLWWARTQQLIALSSAEAELNASIKAGIESLGVVNMGRELDSEHSVEVLCDASANIGINLRVGAGKVKHLGVRLLWLQERVSMGDLKMRKIPRASNCSDALSHHWGAQDGQHTLSQHENAPLRAVIRDCAAREGVWSCRGFDAVLTFVC